MSKETGQVGGSRAAPFGCEAVRVQLSRKRGWRLPENTVVVSRPSRWGNPHDWRSWREDWPADLPAVPLHSGQTSRDDWCRDRAVQAFREDLADGTLTLPVHELRGKNLACWCSLRPGTPCHADVLLELAAKAEGRPTTETSNG